MDQLGHWIERLGIPFAILVAIYMGLARMCRWAMPHIDRWIAAQVKAKEAEAERHQAMSESMTKLVDKTIEIQEGTKETVDQLKAKVPEVCRWKNPHAN